MPPQKAAKKAAKKASGKHDPHASAKDARRTFEHLGRVQALASLTSAESGSLHQLTQTADAAYRVQRYKESADLLRAAEHLSFASLHSKASDTVTPDLQETIEEEFDHLMERSIEHASHHDIPEAIRPLYTRMTEYAHAALQRGSYRCALEFARGAEALSHVHDFGKSALPSLAQSRLPN